MERRTRGDTAAATNRVAAEMGTARMIIVIMVAPIVSIRFDSWFEQPYFVWLGSHFASPIDKLPVTKPDHHILADYEIGGFRSIRINGNGDHVRGSFDF